MLAAALTPVSESLLTGGRERVALTGRSPRGVGVAGRLPRRVRPGNPAVIALHLHELDRLPEEPRREIRRLQRLYVEEWVVRWPRSGRS